MLLASPRTLHHFNFIMRSYIYKEKFLSSILLADQISLFLTVRGDWLRSFTYTYNLPPLVLKARHLGDSAFCTFFVGLGVSGRYWVGFPRIWDCSVVEDKPSELSCTVNQRFLWPQLFMQCFMFLPQRLQGVVKLL